MCWSFYAAIDAALSKEDTRLLRLFWEVSNQVTARFRLNPEEHQLVIDRLALADQLRVKALGSGAQSFFEMVIDISGLPGTNVPNLTCPKLLAILKDLGITYQGNTIEKGLGYAIQAAQTFIMDDKTVEAVRFLERVSPKALDDPTKVGRYTFGPSLRV